MIVEDSWRQTEENLAEEGDSFADILRSVRPYVSTDLIGSVHWDRICERASTLPISIAAFPFGFEIPLHKEETSADYGVSVIASSKADLAIRSSSEKSTFGKGLSKLLGSLTDTSSELHQAVGGKLLLEYDTNDVDLHLQPDPGVFLYPTPASTVGEGTIKHVNDVRCITQAICSAVGRDLTESEWEYIATIYEALCAHQEIGAVGSFPDRDRAIRVACTGYQTEAEIDAFLEAILYHGDASLIQSIANLMASSCAFFGTHLDVTSTGYGPRFGLSVYATENQWARDFEPWSAIVASIEDGGIASHRKLEALRTFCGVETLIGKSGMFFLVRGIHHLKFTISESGVDQLKAYLFLLLLTPNRIS